MELVEDMKHRFYYSEKQNKLGGYNFVIDKKGKKIKYTQWCSSNNIFCNWCDAKLVYACNDKPETKFGTIPDNVKNILDMLV